MVEVTWRIRDATTEKNIVQPRVKSNAFLLAQSKDLIESFHKLYYLRKKIWYFKSYDPISDLEEICVGSVKQGIEVEVRLVVAKYST